MGDALLVVIGCGCGVGVLSGSGGREGWRGEGCGREGLSAVLVGEGLLALVGWRLLAVVGKRMLSIVAERGVNGSGGVVAVSMGERGCRRWVRERGCQWGRGCQQWWVRGVEVVVARGAIGMEGGWWRGCRRWG